MHILVIDPASYIHKDIMKHLRMLFGENSVDEFSYVFKGKDIHDNEEFEKGFLTELQKAGYDCVISTNFYPVVARVCHDNNLPYLAWTYDTPMNVLPCEEMKYETNYIFLFDRFELEKYKRLGYERFYHMTLGVDTEKYDAFHSSGKYRSDIAFVGKLYRSKLNWVKAGLSEQMAAYIEKIIAVQKSIRDKYVVDEFITQPIIDEMNRQYNEAGYGMEINKEQLSYTIAEQVTYLDRVTLLEMMGRRHDTHLYTYDIGEAERRLLKSVRIHGVVPYENEMPILFKSCRINLNSSLRAARSAISLRALDVMGCGGFLLSNAQPELEECFDDRKEVVLFRSEEEALDLADYYLRHPEERKAIANAGYERIKKDFQYEPRLLKMLNIAGVMPIH